MPQADLYAAYSRSKLAPEILKKDAENVSYSEESSEWINIPLKTKFFNKGGYYRKSLCNNSFFVTNFARYERLSGKTNHIYHEEGKPEVFAKIFYENIVS